jgi:hypothetical protein
MSTDAQRAFDLAYTQAVAAWLRLIARKGWQR